MFASLRTPDSVLQFERKMKIALLIYGTLDTMSGGYLYDRVMVDYLRKQGETVDVISVPSEESAFTQDWRKRFCETIRGYDIMIQDELCHPTLAPLNSIICQNNPDMLVIALVHHLKMDEAHSVWRRLLVRREETRYLASVDGYIFNSETTKRSVGNGRKPSVVAYPAGDRFPMIKPIKLIKPRPTRPDAPLRLLYVGNVIKRKGLHTIIAALSQLKVPVLLRVIGDATVDPRYAETVRHSAEHLSFYDTVQWFGKVDDDALAEQLAWADVLVMPSQYEGFGIVYLEAMGCGVLPIGSTAGAAHEIITDGVSGYLVDPENPTQLAQKLSLVARNRGLLAEMQAAAQARFAEFPTWDESMGKIYAFLQSLCESA